MTVCSSTAEMSVGQASPNSLRVVSADETWRRIKPFLSVFGITRVGDITGLDRIGIPVWIAVRPNARTLSVSQGKGLDDSAARVSAAMEAIEVAHAEQPRLPLRHALLTEIERSGEIVALDALPRVRSALFGQRVVIPWTEAKDWTSGASVWVPYEIVHADATVPRMAGAGSFLHSTNGLASGNTLEEAMLHGLCEVIERDAVALWTHSGVGAQQGSRIDLESIADPTALTLFARLRYAGVRPIVWDVTSDIAIATIRVALYDESSHPVTRPIPVGLGAGCHPDRCVALCRAVTEAAQSRLTAITGSRDDLGRPRYRVTQSAEALGWFRETAHAPPGTRPFPSIFTHGANDVGSDLRWVSAKLEAAGLGQILFVDLSRATIPVSVVRAIVPGLEGPVDSPSYRPGQRVRRLRAEPV